MQPNIWAGSGNRFVAWREVMQYVGKKNSGGKYGLVLFVFRTSITQPDMKKKALDDPIIAELKRNTELPSCALESAEFNELSLMESNRGKRAMIVRRGTKKECTFSLKMYTLRLCLLSGTYYFVILK